MEAFGLFHLLQSLLPKTEERAEDGADEGNSPSLQATSEKAENGTETPIQNACLDFLARHDERVKNVRKR
ncbi:MAG: hypothetical protein E7380_06350 [Clostridiales bacterium]|nr:hypothetical protein [Clostridiales bacterium]